MSKELKCLANAFKKLSPQQKAQFGKEMYQVLGNYPDADVISTISTDLHAYRSIFRKRRRGSSLKFPEIILRYLDDHKYRSKIFIYSKESVAENCLAEIKKYFSSHVFKPCFKQTAINAILAIPVKYRQRLHLMLEQRMCDKYVEDLALEQFLDKLFDDLIEMDSFYVFNELLPAEFNDLLAQPLPQFLLMTYKGRRNEFLDQNIPEIYERNLKILSILFEKRTGEKLVAKLKEFTAQRDTTKFDEFIQGNTNSWAIKLIQYINLTSSIVTSQLSDNEIKELESLTQCSFAKSLHELDNRRVQQSNLLTM